MTAQAGRARIRWWAIPLGTRERIPAGRQLRGTWGWDATCACGWDSRTGGATRLSVRRAVLEHRLLEHGERLAGPPGSDQAMSAPRWRRATAGTYTLERDARSYWLVERGWGDDRGQDRRRQHWTLMVVEDGPHGWTADLHSDWPTLGQAKAAAAG